MNISSDIKYFYFVGIGGIGMSALARYFKEKGKEVTGYDRTCTTLTMQLQSEGIDVHYNDDPLLIDKNVLKNKSLSIIIYTPAIPAENKELMFLKNHGYTIYKRADALGKITEEKETLAIAGSHGKTTVTTITATLLHNSDIKCTAFLGGISKNLNSNLIVSDSRYIIVEADEFDRSFLQLHPHLALITAMDADHLDIYGTREEMIKSYCQFISNVKHGGTVIVKKDIESFIPKSNNKKYLTYSLHGPADFYAENIRQENNKKVFDIVTPSGTITSLTLGIPGLLNIENAVAAVSIAVSTGVKEQDIRNTLAKFNGVQRRFDILVNTKDTVYIDDYAHHPEELRAFISSVREHYPERKITGIFQPHLYSRTRDFADDFADALGLLDELILLPIYPAREKPIEGVSSDIILKNVKLKEKNLIHKNELIDFLKNKKNDVLLTIGAGDIDTETENIKNILLINEGTK